DIKDKGLSPFDAKVRALIEGDLREAYKEPQKSARHDKISAAKEKLNAAIAVQPEAWSDGDKPVSSLVIGGIVKDVEKDIVRNSILDTGHRIDGRDTKTVRPIECSVSFLPRTHGSAVFTRGETQALVVTTLGTGEDEQFIDALEGTYKERFLLHYNF